MALDPKNLVNISALGLQGPFEVICIEPFVVHGKGGTTEFALSTHTDLAEAIAKAFEQDKPDDYEVGGVRTADGRIFMCGDAGTGLFLELKPA